jgi:DNA-binding NarL/FixJ family response regulator
MGASGEFTVVGSCEDLRGAALTIDRTMPDVAVTELDVGPRDGASIVRELRRRLAARAGVLIFTGLSSWRNIADAWRSGAAGLVLKTDALETLREGIRVVGAGRPYLTPSVPQTLRELLDRPSGILTALSEREREVFHLVIRGLSNRRIGRELFISPKTVDSHRGRILDKLGCRTAVELVRFAFVNGLAGESELLLQGEETPGTEAQAGAASGRSAE